MRERAHQPADLAAEWMMLPIARPVEPQDLPCRAGRCQRMQHRQNRRRSDARADQQQRALSRLQDEAAARRADVENIAHADMVPQVDSSRPIRLDLHADSIALRGYRTGKRVAPKQWRAASGPLKAQNHVLTGERRSQRLTIRALHRERENVDGFVIDCRNRERPKSW